MKKLLSKLALFLTGTAIAIGVGIAAFNNGFSKTNAEDVALVSLSFPDDNSEHNGVTSYSSTWDAKIGTLTWEISCFNNNNWKGNWSYIKCVNKNSASIATITTKNVLGKKIDKVVVNIGEIIRAEDINSQKLYVASDSAFTQNLQTITVTASAGNNTFIIPNPTSNQYYKLAYDCNKTEYSSHGTLKLNSVTYYYDTDDDTTVLDNLEIRHAPNKTTYIAGDEFDPTGLEVRANYSDSTHVDLGLEDLTITPEIITAETTKVTISYTDNEVTKTVDQAITALTVTDVVSVNTAPLKIQKGETLDASEVTLNVTLSDDSQAVVTATSVSCDTSTIKTVTATASYSGATGTKTTTWQIFVSGPERYFLHTGVLEDGDYVITSDSYALSNTLDGDGRAHNGSFTLDDGTIVNPTEDIIWTIKTFTVEDVRYVTIKNKETDKYLGRSSHLKFADEVGETEKWYISEGDTYEFKSSASSSASRLRQNGTNGWGSYNAGVGKSLTLYKHETPTFSVDVPRYEISDNTYKIGKGDSFAITSSLDNGAVGKVIYTLTSGTGILLTDNDDGTATIEYSSAGSSVVKAHLDGCDDINLYFTTVNQLLPISMAVKTAPNKTKYDVGDSFDDTGLVVTVTWSDKSTSDVSDNLNYSGFNSSDKVLSQEITISYTVEDVTVITTTNVQIVYKIIDVTQAIAKIVAEDTGKYEVHGIVCKKTNSEVYIATKYNETDQQKMLYLYNLDSGVKSDIKVGAWIYIETTLKLYNSKYEAFNPVVIDYDNDPDPVVTGIGIKHEPNKGTYVVGDTTFNWSGLAISVYTNAKSGTDHTDSYDTNPEAFLAIYEITNPDTSHNKGGGKSSVVVTHKETGFYTSFDVSIEYVNVKSISVTKNPTKTTYASGEEFDPTGIEITAIRNNNTKYVITDDSSLTYETNSKDGKVYEGDSSVKVTYSAEYETAYQPIIKTFSTNISINVKAKYVTSISAKLTPGDNSDTYDIGESFNTKRLVVTIHYSDGTEKKYNNTDGFDLFDINVPDMSTAGDKDVTISYTSGGKTFTTTVQIHIRGIEILSIDTKPYRLTYRVGDELDFNGIVISAMYSDSTIEDVKINWDGVTVTGDTSKDGPQQEITISYKGQSDSFKIDVWMTDEGMATLISSEIAKLRALYVQDDYTDENWAKVQKIINDTETVLDDFDPRNDGEHYSSDVMEWINNAKEEINEIPVRSLSKITISGPTKTSYVVGDELDLTGLVVTAHFEDGSTKVLESGKYSLSEVDMSTTGQKTITVTYGNKSASFVITVNEPVDPSEKVLESIAISGTIKNTYVVGEDLDTSGLIVTATYSDQSSQTVTGWTVSGYDKNTTGEQTITVSYTENDVTKTATFTVTVADNPVDPALEEARENAIAEYKDFFDSIDLSGYSEEIIAQFNALKEEALAALGEAATEEEIAAALSNAKAALNNLLAANPKPVPANTNLGLILGLSIGGGVLLAGGVVALVLILKKKKKVA